MKFKTQEQLDGWISQKRSVDYKTSIFMDLLAQHFHRCSQ